MLQRSRLARCSTLMLAVHLVCIAFVFSFILFEVLDIDGSDFPVAPAPAAAALHAVEPSHDIKRTHLMAVGLLAVDLCPPTDSRIDGSIRGQGTPLSAPPVPGSPVVLGYRVTLARSSLLDSPPSA